MEEEERGVVPVCDFFLRMFRSWVSCPEERVKELAEDRGFVKLPRCHSQCKEIIDEVGASHDSTLWWESLRPHNSEHWSRCWAMRERSEPYARSQGRVAGGLIGWRSIAPP
jgi:hypothetical protein